MGGMTRQENDLGRIKGSILRPFLRWVRRDRDELTFREVVEVMRLDGGEIPDPGRRDLGIDPRAWYPAAPVHRAMDRLMTDLPASEIDRMSERAAAGVTSAIQNGVYRMMFRFAFTPDRYAREIQRMWDRLYDNGTVRVDEVDGATHRVTVTDWRCHHPLLCRIQAMSRAVNYRMIGCRDLELHRDLCLDDGGDHCVVTMRWRH